MPMLRSEGAPEHFDRLIASMAKRLMMAVNARVRNALMLHMDETRGHDS